MRRALPILLAAIATMAIAAPTAFGASDPPGQQMGTSTYAVIGDTPYSTFQIQHFPQDIAEINAAPNVSRVIHVGDIKSGSTRCDTADTDPNTGDYTQIKSNFDLFQDPLVYTPGDNEWTDCHRANNGGYVPTERLGVIRSMFFPVPGQTLGQNPASVDVQSAAYPENVTWNESRVQFGMIDVPGSNNDWLPWFGAPRTQAQVDEVTNRTAADLAWIDHIFSQAKASKAKAVVISTQADMWDPAFAGDASQSDHFTPIVQALAKRSLAWDRKVVLFNGDSHVYETDNPLGDPSTPQNQVYGVSGPVDNLMRITVNGSTTPCHQWLELTIDPKSDAIFSWSRHGFANQAPGNGC
ncbi:MAG: hypothetical protein QOH13_1339 [Thermoleophilaceae bacterium]|nr:hypothetical protein [Thermoleophilaceae bacterium]